MQYKPNTLKKGKVMSDQYVDVEIDRNGKVKMSVDGCSGSSCVDLTKDFEKALGEVDDRNKKPEYFQEQRQEINSQNLFN